MAQPEKLYAARDLAELAGIDRSVFYKWLKKNGFETVEARDPASRQIIAALPKPEAKDAIELRKLQGFPARSTDLSRLSPVPPVLER
jgi:predicted DNA-binding transcriptional regulator AlpA